MKALSLYSSKHIGHLSSREEAAAGRGSLAPGLRPEVEEDDSITAQLSFPDRLGKG